MALRSVGILGGLASIALVGYCFYFDRKRRTDPEFRKRLKQLEEEDKAHNRIKLPDISGLSEDEKESHFTQLLAQAEGLFNRGPSFYEEGAEKIIISLAYTGAPDRVLKMMFENVNPLQQQAIALKLQELTDEDRKKLTLRPKRYADMD
eukprot:Pompholyxophrys_punicea_v1_NODE_445_length_1955_cov_6.178947.p1 type:complete len:149 gc:universal NODE_445_length_1955_cov_6.178947:1106-660(-)